MTTLSAEDVRRRPGEYFLVVRSANGHAHVPVDQFDALLESIGKSARDATDPTNTEELLRLLQMLAQKVDDQAQTISQLRQIVDAILNAPLPLDFSMTKENAA